jgi:hypothetical protein
MSKKPKHESGSAWNPLARNCTYHEIVRRWLAETGRLQRCPVLAKHCSYVEFATKLRRELEPSYENAPAFGRKAEAAVYVRMVAASISEGRLWGAAQETARQDREHGHRLVNKQRAERKERERLDAMSWSVLAESVDSYRQRVEGVWPILRSGDPILAEKGCSAPLVADKQDPFLEAQVEDNDQMLAAVRRLRR